MKFVAFWEIKPQDVDKAAEKFHKYREAVRKNPENYVKSIFPAHFLGARSETTENKQGISIFETDDEEKIDLFMESFYPEMRFRILPLLDAAKDIEIYMKTRK